MHATDIEIIPISCHLPDGQGLGDTRGSGHDRATTLIHTDINTDEVDWDEAFAPGSVIAPVVDEFFHDDVVGMDPFNVRRLTGESHTNPYYFGGSIFVRSAPNGIGAALWDLVGKATDKPVHRLLGRVPRETFTVYASTMYLAETDRNIAMPVRDAIDEGFPAAKIKISTGTDSDVERVRAARQLLGNNVRLVVDINGNYRPRQATRTAKTIEKLDITWMEEPTPPESLSGYREAKRSVDVPLTAGGAHYSRFGFRRLVDDRTVDVAQPNLGRCGGLSEASRIADPTSTENVAIRPHVWSSAVDLATAIQLAVSVSDYPHTQHVPDPMLVKFDRSENPLRDEILRSPFDPTSSEVDVPQAPGLGVETDEDAAEWHHADNWIGPSARSSPSSPRRQTGPALFRLAE